MKRFAWIILITFAFAPTTVHAQTTQSTQPIDRATPRGAADALRVAIEAGDEAALRDLLYAADDDTRRLNDALAAVMAASSRLSIAANARFGSDAGKANDPIASRAFAPGELENATTAPVETTGDTATITLPNRDRPMKLVRGRDGHWRFDMLTYAGATTEQIGKQVAMYHELATAINALANDTRDGRFLSVSDLKAAIQDRVHGTIAKSMRKPRPTSGPTTGPTSGPTSAPTTGPTTTP